MSRRILILAAVLAWSGSSRAGPTEPSMDAPAMVITSFQPPKADCSPEKPVVPEQAILLGMTGAVRVEYTVDANGRVGSISLLKSTAHPVLGEAVKRSLDGCAHVAAVNAGRPIALRVSQLYIFKQP